MHVSDPSLMSYYTLVHVPHIGSLELYGLASAT